MRAGALLDDGNRAPDSPSGFEIAQKYNGVCQISDINGRAHIANKAVLRHRQEGRYALAVQILQKFMHVQDERLLLGHGGLIAIDAIDHHRLCAALLDAMANALGKVAGSKFGCVDLLDEQLSAVYHRLKMKAELLSPFEQQAQLLVKHEECRLFAALDSRFYECQRKQ